MAKKPYFIQALRLKFKLFINVIGSGHVKGLPGRCYIYTYIPPSKQ